MAPVVVEIPHNEEEGTSRCITIEFETVFESVNVDEHSGTPIDKIASRRWDTEEGIFF